jgi:predicted aspartyl protease
MSRLSLIVSSLMVTWSMMAPGQTPVPVSPPDPPGPFIRPAIIDDTLEVTGDALAARRIETRMALDVRVNGAGPFRFVVDSGADRTVIGAGLAARLALPPGGKVMLHSMGAPRAMETVAIGSLRIGANEMSDLSAPALPEEFLGAQGLIGIDALAGQRLTLDFERKTITLQDTRIPEKVVSRMDEVVVTARRRKGQLILTQASAGRVPLAAVIDTGAQVTIGNSALRAKAVARRMQFRSIKMIAVTGEEVMADLVVLPEVKIGGLVLSNLPVAFADVAPFKLFGLAEQPAVLLGTDVMQVFRRVSLDFKNRKIRFVLPPRR